MNQPTPSDARLGTGGRAFTTTRHDPLQGRVVLGNYRINSRLARGGMSSVYLSRHVRSGEIFAVKVLSKDLALDPGVQERFLNESRAIQRIDHPSVIRIYEVGEIYDGRMCLVMEYVPGISVRKLMTLGPLDPTSAMPLLMAIAQGLCAAHEKSVIHRDLKPENVLVMDNPGPFIGAKIIDFGIARILDAPGITTTEHVMGTPQYIAPEQAMAGKIDHRADIYAFGVMMYELLKGWLPFSGDDPDILLQKHISTPPPPLCSYSGEKDIPDRLHKLVMDCLAKSPDGRPANMNEVINVLEAVALGE